MTQEEKAKAYDKAIEKAKAYHNDYTNDIMEEIFPELKESEDEKIRKVLVDYFKRYKEQEECGIKTFYGIPTDNVIAWLKKQGEQKPTDKVEPKFKNGQWIVWQNKCYKVNYNGCGYELIDQNGLSTSLEYVTVDENAHLWTIQDAKDGDVLYLQKDGKEHIIIYKGVIKERFRTFVSAYCAYNGIVDAFCFADVNRYVDIAYRGIMPATKEQRDFLFQKMKESGYEWDAYKKELKKIEQKPAWSEEDERNLNDAILFIETGTYSLDKDNLINWLKSLKERMADNHPNLTWEDIRKICIIAKNVHKYYGFWTQDIYEEILDRFNKPEVWT